MKWIKLYEEFNRHIKLNNQSGDLIQIGDIIKCIKSGGVIYATIINNFPKNDPDEPLRPVSVDEWGLVTIDSGHSVSIKNIEKIEFPNKEKSLIKEGISDLANEKQIWKLSEEDILDFFPDFTTSGWYIEVKFGFVVEKSKWEWGSNINKEYEEFSDIILPGKKVEPAYLISIDSNTSPYRNWKTDVDLSPGLEFANSAFNDIMDQGEVIIRDGDGQKVNIDQVEIKRWSHQSLSKAGIKQGRSPIRCIKSSDGEILEHPIELDSLEFFLKTGYYIDISEKEFADTYDLDYDRVDDKDNIYVHIELEDMVHILLDSRSKWIDVLVDGIESLWENYDVVHYIPDIISLIAYLNSENRHLLVSAIIKEIGGLDLFRENIRNFNSDLYSKISEMKEDELIKFLLDERFYKTIGLFSTESDVYSEVSSVVADFSMSAHVDQNWREIVDAFDRIVGNEFEYKKITKEVIKKKRVKGGIREYKSEETFYEIRYNSKWFLEYGDFDISDYSTINQVFRDFCDQVRFYHRMNPSLSDWGNVNRSNMNSEISAFLKNYLK
jgi:hypothetical protein